MDTKNILIWLSIAAAFVNLIANSTTMLQNNK